MIKHIRRVDERVAAFIWAIVGIFASVFFIEALQKHSSKDPLVFVTMLILGFPTVFLLVALVVRLRRMRWLKARNQELVQFAEKNNLQTSRAALFGAPTITLAEIGKRSELFSHAYDVGNLTYGDYSYAIYHQTKYGEYKAATIYYSVCYAKLPRELPQLFFDAKKSKGKEFWRLFSGSQKQHLEGDFDTYFDTYFPAHYAIDSLSFITPEVMQSMIAAKDYDIEITGDKVYLYGPLKAMPAQLEEMLSLTQGIYKALMNNIVTYRDERLDYSRGRQGVSLVGMQLRRNLTIQYVWCALGLFMAVLFILIRSAYKVYVPFLLIFSVGILLDSGNKIQKELSLRRTNDRLNRSLTKKEKT